MEHGAAEWMLIGSVARRLGVSVQRVRQLDDALKPQRTLDGKRLYSAASVEAFAQARAAAREARAS